MVLLDLGHGLGDVETGADSWLETNGDRSEGFQRLLGSYSSRYGGLETSFVLQFDPQPIGGGTWTDPAAPTDGSVSAAGASAGVWVRFPAGTEVVVLRTALSYVDLEGARANLAEEMPDTASRGATSRMASSVPRPYPEPSGSR